jgi:hypothetical protein
VARALLLLCCLLLATPPAPASADTRVVGAGGRFLYVVDGLPQPIRGMGYNAILTDLPPDQRLARLDRDFALMRRVGVNTVLGWDQAGFDRAMLDVAQAHGLGVIAHFELGKDWDYGDPALRQRLLEEVGQWADALADHPALRMWGVGNEVMLAFDDEQSARFAAFYVELYQAVRQRDLRHPVLYREAEDVRAPFFRDAFRAAGVPPADFVFGMNFYTPRVDDALADWPAHDFDVPVLISEFAPAGFAPMTRPAAFGDLWRRVLKHEQFVLGATPYVWTTEGPEAVDRIFGLTDGHGRPVDGSLAALQRLYLGRAPAGELLPAPVPRAPQPLDVTLDAGIARALARAVSLPDLEPIDLAAAQAQLRGRYAAELAAAPGAARADPRRMARMLDLLVQTGVLAQLRRGGAPIYPGAVEALPLLAGMARWATVDPGAEGVAEDFLTEVIAQALRPPAAGAGTSASR